MSTVITKFRAKGAGQHLTCKYKETNSLASLVTQDGLCIVYDQSGTELERFPNSDYLVAREQALEKLKTIHKDLEIEEYLPPVVVKIVTGRGAIYKTNFGLRIATAFYDGTYSVKEEEGDVGPSFHQKAFDFKTAIQIVENALDLMYPGITYKLETIGAIAT